MAKRNLKSILVRMPSTLKRRLAREVARRESTLNDVAVEILAAEFGVDFQPSGRRGPIPGDTGVVLLRMPPELKRQLDAAARERQQQHEQSRPRDAQRAARRFNLTKGNDGS